MTQTAIVVRVEAASEHRNCPDRDACPRTTRIIIPGHGRHHFWFALKAAS